MDLSSVPLVGSVPRRFILLNEQFAKKINEDSRASKQVIKNEIFLVRGTLLEEICSHHDHLSANQVPSLCLRSLDHTGICVVQCVETDVQELDIVEVDLLYPVTPIKDRIRIITNRGWFESALLLSEDSNVFLNLGDNFFSSLEGVVRYRGPVPELGKGIMFGVELLTHPELGECDGSIRGKRYFQCNGNSGVFVPINRLELVSHSSSYRYNRGKDTFERNAAANNLPRPSSLASSSAALPPLSLDEVCKDGCPPPPLKIGDRIVWISDTGPEYGEVKWLGKLPDVGTDWMVGVEFDNPIGSGTGNYNDHQLFEARQNHASLVPIIGLMKAKDFLGTPPGTPPKPRRRKKTSELQAGTSTDRVSTARQPLTQTNINAETALPFQESRESHKTRLPPLPTSNLSSNNCIKSLPPLATENGCSQYSSIERDKKRSTPSATVSDKFGSSNQQTTAVVGSPHATNKYLSSSLPPISAEAVGSGGPISPEKCGSVRTDRDDSSVTNSLNSLNIPANSKKAISKSFEDDSYLASLLNNTDLEVGSVVEVMVNGMPRYGVIHWIGIIPEETNNNRLVAGIEMEDESVSYTDGTFNGKRYFQCPPRKAFFVRLSQCRKDSRFLETERRRSAVFGSIDCPSVYGDVPPLSTPDDLRLLCGKNRGIQGHHNSCYLDATLFAMFSCTSVFDSLLHRPPGPDDIPEYTEVQRVLKEEIVNPLRAHLYVRADRVMQLRTLLERLSSVRGLTCEEKDPEEFLNSLLNQILKAEPFLKLSSNQESYFYQLFVEKDEKLSLPTVQQLFDQSFLTSDIKLREVPSCLLIQMPRFGKQFKMYPRIIPSQYLDITDVLEDSPRQCSVCGQVAEYECKECFGQFGEGLDSTAFCQRCIEKSHSHKKRSRHKSTKLSVPSEFRMLKDHTHVPRIYVELFAVVCIETSHYVCFVKCGSGPDAPWCFFDSMADRKGEQNGYNIPEVVSFPDLRWWLSEEGAAFLSSAKDDKVLPEIARRLLCDAYMCMYQSPDIMMYR